MAVAITRHMEPQVCPREPLCVRSHSTSPAHDMFFHAFLRPLRTFHYGQEKWAERCLVAARPDRSAIHDHSCQPRAFKRRAHKVQGVVPFLATSDRWLFTKYFVFYTLVHTVSCLAMFSGVFISVVSLRPKNSPDNTTLGGWVDHLIVCLSRATPMNSNTFIGSLTFGCSRCTVEKLCRLSTGWAHLSLENGVVTSTHGLRHG